MPDALFQGLPTTASPQALTPTMVLCADGWMAPIARVLPARFPTVLVSRASELRITHYHVALVSGRALSGWAVGQLVGHLARTAFPGPLLVWEASGSPECAHLTNDHPNLQIEPISSRIQLVQAILRWEALSMAMTLRTALLNQLGRDVAPVVGAALTRLADQRALFAAHAPGSPDATGHGAIREVGGLAESLGVSTRYLQREAMTAGIRLSKTVRWFTVFHALALYVPRLHTWEATALALGFRNGDELAKSCKRLTGLTPSHLARVPWRSVLARALCDVIRQ